MKPENRPLTMSEEEELNWQHLREICQPIKPSWPPSLAEILEAEKDDIPF